MRITRNKGTTHNITSLRICPVGLTRSETNITCRSCIRQNGDIVSGCFGKRPSKKPEDIGAVKTWIEGNTLVTTAKLPTANTWHGRPRYVYQAEKDKWRFALMQSVKVWGRATGPRMLRVTKYIRHPHHAVKDADNRTASIKPLKDVLVEYGILTDDTDEDVTFEVIELIGSPRVEIVVTDAPNPDPIRQAELQP